MICALMVGVVLGACANEGGSRAGHDARPLPELERPRARRAARRAVLRFAVIGDMGSGGSEQKALAKRMCRFRRRRPFNVVITTGDNVYPDGARRRFRRKFFEPYACLLRAGVKFHASLGNHDYVTRRGGPELTTPAFGMRARNYVVRRKHVRFVVVDSNRLRMRWLRRRLWTARGDRWTIVVFHHPVYSPGLHGSTPGLRPRLPRLFRRTGIDLVLNGHDHIYSYSRPLDGIRYVVTGGGGASLYPCSSQPFSAMCRERHHFLYVVARSRRIRVRAVPINGRPFGTFSTTGAS